MDLAHQMPIILKYSERIFGTQQSQILLVNTLPAGITSLYEEFVQSEQAKHTSWQVHDPRETLYLYSRTL